MAKNMKEIAKQIEKLAAKAMQNGNSVKNVAIKTAQNETDRMIYSYEPRQYERTGKLKESWETFNDPNGIVLDNTYEDGGKDIAETVHTGIGYDYTGYGYEYEKPRPIFDTTRNELEDGRLTNALKKDLNKIGIKTN